MNATRVGGALLIAGGSVALPLWVVFTNAHGPTSFNENRLTLGRDVDFWGMLLGVIPNVLVAAGVWLSRPILLRGGDGGVRVGYWVVLVALLISAGLDLTSGTLGPPSLLPFVAVGLVMLAVAGRTGAGLTWAIRSACLALGVLLGVAFGWALTPLDVFDSVGGYRIYGAMAHLLAGLGWATVGALIVRHAD